MTRRPRRDARRPDRGPERGNGRGAGRGDARGDTRGDLGIGGRDDLAAVTQIDLVAVVIGRVVRRGHHDAGIAAEFTNRERQYRGG